MAAKRKKRGILPLIICLVVIIILIIPVFLFNAENLTLNDNTRATLPGSFVQLPDGVVHYEQKGPADAQIVVLVHGFSVPFYIWDHTYNALAEAGFHVLRYDLYGRGYSDRPKVDCTINLFITQLNDLLTALNIRQPVNLVALSVGGPVAAGFFYSYPGKVHTLCFIDPVVAPVQSGKIFPLNIPVIGEYIMDIALAPFILPRSQADDFYRPDRFPGWEDRYRDQMRYRGFKKALLSTIRSMAGINALPWYKAIGASKISVLFLRGEADKSIPATEMEQFRQAVPQAELHIIKEAGHLPQYEQPGTVNPLLIRFLKGAS